MTPAPARASTPARVKSLRASWNRSFAVLVIVIVVCAAASIIGTRQLVGSFSGSARDVERAATKTAELRTDIVSHALLVGGPSTPAHDRQLAAAAANVRRGFNDVIVDEQASTARNLYTVARATWSTMVQRTEDPDPAVRARTVVSAVPRVLSLIEEGGTISRAEARTRLEDTTWQYRMRRAVLALLQLVVIWLALRLARRLSTEVLQPVRRLRDSANRLAAGEYDERVVVDRADELGDLALSFNAMADAIAGSQRTLTRKATTDSVTGLANRTSFHEQLAAVLKAPPRRSGTQGVLFVDLDDFKDVNDTLGHRAGDEVLRVIAARLTEAIRPGDLVARVGGDEFAVLLDGIVETEHALTVAQRMLAAATEPVVIGPREVSVGASIGLAMRGPSSSVESLMHEADVAMYAAKSNGKNRIEHYDAGLDDVAFATRQS